MKCLTCAALLLLGPLAARGADAPKPNALTAQEVADGWLLLFDGRTTFGWHVEGDAKTADGALVLGGAKPTKVRLEAGFGPCEYRMEFRLEGKDAEFRWCQGAPPIGFGAYDDKKPGWGAYTLTVHENASSYRLRSSTGDLGVEANGSPFGTKGNQMTPPGEKMVEQVVGPAFEVPAGSKLLLRSIKLKPLGLKSIFNGKDLSGWREFPAKKSRFTATKEGWIHLQNGPGDLQTTGAWADFVLQIDCKSNGPHLNSGVFFRCIPREYQNGYEAQIRNEFTADPTQQYTIEEYDPTSHKRVGKKTVNRTAVDYGTGGIYRRFPARREVAKDHEWFTMTVAAAGRHLAVWVNGFPVTDWTDNRPLAENPRNGCRLKAGPISLQGHDKTTDLDFRKIRIAELPRAGVAK
jgi:hypothetical protein